MWFKNLRVYRLTGPFDLSTDRLESALEKQSFAPCGKLDHARQGWVPPLGRHGQLYTHTVGSYIMICARKQEKILPPAAVSEAMEEKVEAFESAEARKIFRRERTRLKDEVIFSLLPRALTRSALTYAYFDVERKYLIVDASTPAKAEELVEHLRVALGDLPAVPLTCQGDVADIMTRWVQNGAPRYFELDNECDLQNRRESKNVVRCRNQDLDAKEVLNHITAGKRVMQLAIVWRDGIRFVLSEDFGLKRLRFEDKIQSDAESDTDNDDVAAKFDQEFAVMTVQLSSFLDDLIATLGGIAD